MSKLTNRLTYSSTLLFIFLVLIQTTSLAQAPIAIGIIRDNSFQDAEFKKLVQAEIGKLCENKYEIEYQEASIAELKNNPQKVEDLLELMDQPVDMLISLGLKSSKILASFDTYPIPCIGGISIEKTNKTTSGIDNFTFVQSPFSVKKDFATLKKMVDFKKLGIFVDKDIQVFVEPFIRSLSDGFDIAFFNVSGNPENDISSISPDIDALYILPSIYEDTLDQRAFFAGINAKKIPTFSLSGREDVKNGALASIAPSEYFGVYARRLAIDVLKIIEGQNPKDFEIDIRGIEDDFVINYETMRAIEIYPSLELLSTAQFINLEKRKGEKFSLEGAILYALEHNLAYQSALRNIDIQSREQKLALSNLLPNISASSSLVTLDNQTSDLLVAGNQLTPQTEWAGNLQLSQIIYSEPAVANAAIQKMLVAVEKQGVRVNELDLVLDVCTGYMRYLQAKANVRIQNKNVETSVKNLNIAKNKANIGVASIADVKGLESQLAVNRISLNEATTNFEQAKISFNQLLNRPLNEDFELEDVFFGQQIVFIADTRINENVNNENDIRKFNNFLIDYTLKNAPELQQLDWLIKAQERSLLMNKRSIFIPQIAVQGSLDKTLGRYGTKVADANFEAIGIDPYQPTWNIGASASIPLFQGNLRKNKIEKDKVLLNQLQIDKSNSQLAFKSNIRFSIENLGKAYNDLLFTQEAQQSSGEFLAVIQELYKGGATNINTLLSAQNSALSAEVNATSALYQFFINAFVVERLTNRMYLISTASERESFINEFNQFILRK